MMGPYRDTYFLRMLKCEKCSITHLVISEHFNSIFVEKNYNIYETLFIYVIEQ